MDRSVSFKMYPAEEETRHSLLDRSPLGSDIESGGGIGMGILGRKAEARARFLARIRWRAYSGLVLRRIVVFLMPSFTHHRFSTQTRERRGDSTVIINDNESNINANSAGAGSTNKKTLSPTAYLDGMRGVAALFVFFCHYFYTAFFIAEGYGRLPPSSSSSSDAEAEPTPKTSQYTSLWRLPFIRLLYSGPSMVCVFFVISGYALSLRPLQLAARRSSSSNNNSEAAFARATSSLIFRRFFRLYLPPIISTLCIALLVSFGAFEDTRGFTTDRTYMRNVIEYHPDRIVGGVSQQLMHWAREMWAFVEIWSWADHAGSTRYDVHLWTIPLEFRCSMVLFLVLIGTARLRENVRLVVVAVLTWYVLRCDRWEMVLFLAGMTIAELDVRRNAHDRGDGGGTSTRMGGTATLPTIRLLLDDDEKNMMDLYNASSSSSSSPPPPSPGRRFTSNSLFWNLVSIFALYLLSCPDAGPWDVPGWRFLGSLIPGWFIEKYRFWQVVGACLFVFCAARSRGWQRVFELPAIQYLGHLSYAVYLMHGPVTHLLGLRVQRWAWGVTGTTITDDGSDSAYKSGVVLAAVINIPLVIWAADIFWRAIDIPTVRFAKWLESRLIVQ